MLRQLCDDVPREVLPQGCGQQMPTSSQSVTDRIRSVEERDMRGAKTAKTIALLALCLVAVRGDADAQCLASQDVDIISLRGRLDGALDQLEKTGNAERATPEYRRLQEQALIDLEQLQCAEELSAPSEAVKRGPGVQTPFATVPVVSITDRSTIVATAGRHEYFGPDRSQSGVSYDRLLVRMPAEGYTPGAALPAGVTIDNEASSGSGVSLLGPTTLSREQFTEQLRAFKKQIRQASPTSPTRILLFVHGFNVSYPEAAKAVARLAFGTGLSVFPIVLSWPSQAAVLQYWHDEEIVEPSTERFRPVLQFLLSHPDVDEVIIVAHSMGSRLVTRMLSQLQLQGAAIPKLTRVSMAAADISEAEIRELWPRVSAMPTKGWLFYTSSNDFALRASFIVHSNPPVGDSRARIFTLPPSDTVDASAVAPTLRGYGHSYVIDNPALTIDLRRWIAQGLAVSDRGLVKGNRPPAVFWSLPEKRKN